MVTALARTYTAGAGVTPPSVLLAVTGAPSAPAAVYTSNFATVDGWVAGTATISVAGGLLRVRKTPAASYTAYNTTRAMTGLVAATRYRMRVKVGGASVGQIRIGADSPTVGSWQSVPSGGFVDYWFVSGGSTATLYISVQTTAVATDPDYFVSSVTLTPIPVTWTGTTILRTDVNGTDIPVREDRAGNDTVAGAMTIRDYEAALVGPVNYRVVDGAGASTSAAALAAPVDPGVWLTLPATAGPGTPTPPTARPIVSVLDFDEASSTRGTLHEVIGRADPLGNPGPLSTRAGSFTLWCADYAAADAVRAMLAGGDVALLRQPTHSSLDLYFLAQRVALAWDDETSRWLATVTYQEVLAP